MSDTKKLVLGLFAVGVALLVAPEAFLKAPAPTTVTVPAPARQERLSSRMVGTNVWKVINLSSRHFDAKLARVKNGQAEVWALNPHDYKIGDTVALGAIEAQSPYALDSRFLVAVPPEALQTWKKQ